MSPDMEWLLSRRPLQQALRHCRPRREEPHICKFAQTSRRNPCPGLGENKRNGMFEPHTSLLQTYGIWYGCESVYPLERGFNKNTFHFKIAQK